MPGTNLGVLWWDVKPYNKYRAAAIAGISKDGIVSVDQPIYSPCGIFGVMPPCWSILLYTTETWIKNEILWWLWSRFRLRTPALERRPTFAMVRWSTASRATILMSLHGSTLILFHSWAAFTATVPKSRKQPSIRSALKLKLNLKDALLTHSDSDPRRCNVKESVRY